MRSGDWAISRGIGGDLPVRILDWLLRTFGRSHYTHTLVQAGDLMFADGIKVPTAFEADLLMKDTPDTELSTDIIWVHWTHPDILKVAPEAVRQVRAEQDGKLYGIFQLPWFVELWIVEILHLPARWAKHNWFHSGPICTFVVYLVIERIAKLLQPTNPALADQVLFYLNFNGRGAYGQRPRDFEQIRLTMIKMHLAV